MAEQHASQGQLRQQTHGQAPRMRSIVRIANTDLDGNSQAYIALTKIHGVSYGISNALCHLLSINRQMKMIEVPKETVAKVEQFLQHPQGIPPWVMNRRADPETGENHHIIGNKLTLRHEFDIRILKKLRTYRGMRHSLGLPTRGQRTKAHFRKRGATVGVMKKAAKIATAAAGKKDDKKEKK